jgi:hypothetical protein
MKLRKIILSLSMVLAFAAVAMAHEHPAQNGEPKLVIESFTHDFGEVKSGTPLEYSFVIKNQGKADLLIKSVAPGCGCTSSDFDKVIAPGKEGKIKLAVPNTQGYAGEVAKSAAVITNDLNYPNFNLLLRAHFKLAETAPVQPNAPPKVFSEAGKRIGALSVAPSDTWITSVIRGSSASIALYIYSHSGKPIHVKSIVPGGNSFTAQLQPIQDGKRYQLNVATDPNLKAGKYQQTLKVLTDSPETPELTMSLEATVYPQVIATPTAIMLPNMPFEIDPATVKLPEIYIRKIREGGLKIKTVHSSLPFLRVSLIAEEEGKTYKIQLAFDKARMVKKGEFKGIIRVETNDIDSSVIEIPLQGAFN